MVVSVALMRKISDLEPSLREVILLLLEEMERQRQQLEQQVTQDDFRELKALTTSLIEAQKQAEVRLTRLEETVAELAEAQKRTEAQLAAFMKETNQRFQQVEMRLTRLEETVAELAEAQKRTEEELRLLAGEVRILRDRVEGVSNTVGYTLEDRALQSLPALLAEQGLQVEGRLVRKYIAFPDKMRQINIFGYARRGDERLLVLGEAKVRPSRKDIDRFLRLAHRIAEQEGLPTHLLFIAYDFPPDIEAYAHERGVQPVWSYTLAV